MRYLIPFLFLFLPVSSYAKSWTFTIDFTQECLTVDGDSLDLDGDGVCELLTGFRVFTEEGSFITAIPEDGTRSIPVTLNLPVWTVQCFQMTAVMDDRLNPGEIIESALSNVGACDDVIPGRPNGPQITN